MRAELQKHKIDAGCFELREALGHLFRSSDKAGTQAAIRNGIVFQGNTLLELRASQPLLVIGVSRSGLLDVCNAPEFVLSLALGFADDGVTGNSEFQRRQIMTRTPSADRVSSAVEASTAAASTSGSAAESAGRIRATRSRPSVSVPVLSLQITVPRTG